MGEKMTMDFDLSICRQSQEDARVQLGGMLQDLNQEVENAKHALIDKMNEMLAVEAQQAKLVEKLEDLKVQKAQLSARLQQLEERFVRASNETGRF